MSGETLENNGQAGQEDAFAALLDYLKSSRGFDFSGYKPSSLMRRVEKQMQTVGIEGYGGYGDYLEVHPEEFGQLFDTILINVTGFFRDAPAWDYLSEDIIPRILSSKSSSEPIRIWSAGCASGQEPCSLAMAMAEALGRDQFRERVKIYGTDLDEEALSQARASSYTAREVQSVPPALLEKYFELDGSRYVFDKDLRRALIYGRHDLLQDAPISRVDLLVCRNTLMYFNSEVQAKILSRFHFAVGDGKYLFLGKAEMLFSHPGLFLPLDLKRRIFVKVAKDGMRDRLLLMAQTPADQMESPLDAHLRLRESVFHTGPVAQIIVDLNGLLAMANERARTLFHLSGRDIGRPLRDLELSYRPVELRSCIEQSYAERRTVQVKEIPWTASGSALFLDTTVVPLLENGLLLGASISFTDVTRTRQLADELQETGRELETAYEELQSTNEELETTNEELHSTVEELETTNEELQSTNEELETTNEELQSTNVELQTLNEEMRLRSGELNQVNAFLESILLSLRGGVIVLDRDLHVQIWNVRSQDMWGLRSDEVQGKPFLTLDIGLPVEELIAPIRACLANPNQHRETTVTARNRRGKTIACCVNLTPLIGMQMSDAPEAVHGVILLVEEQSE